MNTIPASQPSRDHRSASDTTSFKPEVEQRTTVRSVQSQISTDGIDLENGPAAVFNPSWGYGSLSVDPTIEILVGEGEATRSFKISRKLLCDNSRYIEHAIRQQGYTCIELVHYDPLVFEMFATWLDSRPSPITYTLGKPSEGLWRSNALRAWALAYSLQAEKFERYSLSQFIANMDSYNDHTKLIERTVHHGLSLRRFYEHWVAYKSATSSRGQSAASTASLAMGKIQDPRIYDLEHWYNPCADSLTPTCLHDPQNREAAKRYASENTSLKATYVAICSIYSIVDIALAAALTRYISPPSAMRGSTAGFALFTACFGLVSLIATQRPLGLAAYSALPLGIYMLFALASGAAAVQDAYSCWSAQDLQGDVPCKELTALAVFMWTSLVWYGLWTHILIRRHYPSGLKVHQDFVVKVRKT